MRKLMTVRMHECYVVRVDDEVTARKALKKEHATRGEIVEEALRAKFQLKTGVGVRAKTGPKPKPKKEETS